MSYSKYLTQTVTTDEIETVDWKSFVDIAYIYEFNCIVTLPQLFTTSLRDVENAIEAVLWNFDPSKKVKLAREGSLVYAVYNNGYTYPSRKVIVEEDMESLNLPETVGDWSISSNDLKNYAVATKELDSGLICVNIAMFANPR